MLDGIRALATEQNWARVSAFLGTLAPSGDRAILIAAAPGLVLLIGVEIIGTLADLAVVERAIWQALLGPADEDWAGQDLSGYGCLIWVDPADPVDSDLADPAGQAGLDPAVPGFLAERIARDRALALD